MPSRTRTPSDHREIASALKALYTMMHTLALLDEDDQIFLPPHPDHMLNTEYALEAGFSQEAVDALQQMPYIPNTRVEFLPSTDAQCWITRHPDVDFYHNERYMMPGIEDNLMPPSAIRISTVGTDGYVFIYDASTKLLHLWEPFKGNDAPEDYREVAGKPVWEVFKPILSSYQRLENVGNGGGDMEFFGPEGFMDDPNSPTFDTDDATEAQREMTRELYERTKALWELRDIYLDCGWDVEAEGLVQPTFQRDEFIVRRKDHLGL